MMLLGRLQGDLPSDGRERAEPDLLADAVSGYVVFQAASAPRAFDVQVTNGSMTMCCPRGSLAGAIARRWPRAQGHGQYSHVSSPIDYERQRQEFVVGVHEPTLCEPLYGTVDDPREPPRVVALAFGLSAATYPVLRRVFSPIAEPEANVTLARFFWKGLAPPPELYSKANPILVRLDLAFSNPARFRLPILFKLLDQPDYDNLSAVALTGMLDLRLLDVPTRSPKLACA
jgi:hypothetical protein